MTRPLDRGTATTITTPSDTLGPSAAGRRDSIYDLPTPGPWSERGRCRDVGVVEMFFPGSDEDALAAMDICAGCAVRADCLAYAIPLPRLVGVWGGTDEAQRRRLRRAAGAAPRAGRCRPRPPRPSLERFLRAGALAFDVSVDELAGRGRTPALLRQRHAVMLACRTLAGASYPTIGAAFGRDHTTAMNGCRRAEQTPELVEAVLAAYDEVLDQPRPTPAPTTAERPSSLEADVAQLRADMAAVRADLDELLAELRGTTGLRRVG